VNCRCDGLKETFGSAAPTCGPCVLAARKDELCQAGLATVNVGHYQAYRDCGLDPISLSDHTVWVPDWAAGIVTALFNTDACGPTLTRAVVDLTFREQCILALSGERPGALLRGMAERAGLLL
jgi:antirestriction protein ArdC